MHKLKILVLMTHFWKIYPKHQQKSDMIKAIEPYAEVRYWHKRGDIADILEKLAFRPDFIFHYDTAYNYAFAPRIGGLDRIDIPKGCLVIDLHVPRQERIDYIERNRIDLIFSITKRPFLDMYPQYADKFRWLPWSMNPDVIRDWGLKKEIKYLLMGQLHVSDPAYRPKRNPAAGEYPFREAVFRTMRDVEGFVFHPHPGHEAAPSANVLIDRKYAEELNRADMFFTCGGKNRLPVLKYFEAPGCRTLLLAETSPDIEELGFRDGEHYVACTEADVYEKAMYYANHPEERQAIADNGYALVHERHTNAVRAREFVEDIADYIDGRNGSAGSSPIVRWMERLTFCGRKSGS